MKTAKIIITENLLHRDTIFVFSFLLLSVLFFSGCEGDRTNRFEDWDRDRDLVIVEDEFAPGIADVGYYEAWDLDNDGYIDKIEWETGVSTYYPEYDFDVYGYYDAWDVDAGGTLDEDEFVVGTFHLWDTDKDGQIEEVEYEEWYYEID